jgi:hypothetical protein
MIWNHNTSPLEQHPDVQSARADLWNEREHRGQCLSCGQQLYNVVVVDQEASASSSKKQPAHLPASLRKLFRKNSATDSTSGASSSLESSPTASSSKRCKEPIHPQQGRRTSLTIPGKVDDGVCLVCHPSSTIGGRLPTYSASLVGSASSARTTGAAVKKNSHQKETTDDDRHTKNARYTGEYNVYGERDGRGTLRWDNGDVYTGSFFNGKLHGHGTLSFAANSTINNNNNSDDPQQVTSGCTSGDAASGGGGEYVGEWECGYQHGTGTRRWSNGDMYTGHYWNGQRTGEGRFYFANGDLYVGQWKNGVMEGAGRYYYRSGQRFEGTFGRGKRVGKGKLQRTNGDIDLGLYVSDVRVGLGVRWNADRTVAWKMIDGKIQHRITIAEAVALDYDLEAAAVALERVA